MRWTGESCPQTGGQCPLLHLLVCDLGPNHFPVLGLKLIIFEMVFVLPECPGNNFEVRVFSSRITVVQLKEP